jgi:hypothetical protein
MTTDATRADLAPDPLTLEAENDARRIKFVLFTIGVLLFVNISASLIPSTKWWKSAVFAVALNLSLYAAYTARYRDWKLLRWLVVVVVAGFVELVADWWLVMRAGPILDGVQTGNLIYGEMPKIWKSPAYMPLAWAGVLVQIMALGVWLRGRLGMVKATLITALIGGINIPVYEMIARWAEWWIYVHVPMAVKNAPWYIIVGEFLCCLPLVWIGVRAERARVDRLILLGVLAGAGIFVAYWVAFQMVGHCGDPLGSSFAGRVLDFVHGCQVPRGAS